MTIRVILDEKRGMFYIASIFISLFIFQAEDGIRDYKVTGVQTCALPILSSGVQAIHSGQCTSCTCAPSNSVFTVPKATQIGRASCREREWIGVGAVGVIREARKEAAKRETIVMIVGSGRR